MDSTATIIMVLSPFAALRRVRQEFEELLPQQQWRRHSFS
jgi:hypothetical protein